MKRHLYILLTFVAVAGLSFTGALANVPPVDDTCPLAFHPIADADILADGLEVGTNREAEQIEFHPIADADILGDGLEFGTSRHSDRVEFHPIADADFLGGF